MDWHDAGNDTGFFLLVGREGLSYIFLVTKGRGREMAYKQPQKKIYIDKEKHCYGKTCPICCNLQSNTKLPHTSNIWEAAAFKIDSDKQCSYFISIN